MQFKALISAALLAATSYAQLQFTSFPPLTGLQVGQTVNLTWSGATAGQPVTILLRSGNAANLETQQTITSSATGNSYQWTPSSSIADGSTYALEILQGTEFNYTPQFSIQGGTAASVSASQSSLLSSVSASASSVLASASSAAASATMTSSTSASITSSASTSGASSSSQTSSSAKTSSTGGATSSTSGAAVNGNVQSPLALILGAVAAMIYFQ